MDSPLLVNMEDVRPFHIPNATVAPSRSRSGSRNFLSAQEAPQLQPVAVNGSNPANFTKLVTAPAPEERRRPSVAHSRSNSVNGAKEPLGNVNRWSESTCMKVLSLYSSRDTDPDF